LRGDFIEVDRSKASKWLRVDSVARQLVAAWRKVVNGEIYLFVYGTLRRKAKHSVRQGLLEERRLLGTGTFRGRLYDLGRFPGAIPSNEISHRVFGEIYRIEEDRKTFQLLDEYEGSHFRRARRPVVMDNGKRISAWIYLYVGPMHSAKIIRNGDYLAASQKEKPSSPSRVKKISSRLDVEKAFAVRLRVFVKEQGVPPEIELDRDDKRASHFLATVRGRAVGTARVVIRHGGAKIGRMAVLKSYRRKGVGKTLLKRAIVNARKLGAEKIYLHAQVPVIEFYEKMGFRCVGPVFDEAGILHRKMILEAIGSRQQAIAKRR
jgi:predicted GNAT family N-acyltransferase/gamma-glutamylcyclotransferase (GGCT)/AIG2-like uncharacterized protein YtfP